MAKGGAFERAICKQLSLWWSGGKDSDVFWRTSNSGGRATVRGKKGQRTSGHYGDVAATDSRGQPLIDLLTIEIKRGYNRSTIADLLDKPGRAAVQQYEAWFAKCRVDAKAAGSFSWMLIHKRDQRDPLVFIPFDALDSIPLLPISWTLEFGVFIRDKKYPNSTRKFISGVPLLDFLKFVRPADITDLSRRI